MKLNHELLFGERKKHISCAEIYVRMDAVEYIMLLILDIISITQSQVSELFWSYDAVSYHTMIIGCVPSWDSAESKSIELHHLGHEQKSCVSLQVSRLVFIIAMKGTFWALT